MSGPSVPWLDTEFLVEGRFDAKHIQSFGFADIGPIYMTLNTKWEIVQATAKLIDTTFKEMLIEDPKSCVSSGFEEMAFPGTST
jgi:hypothetical protein